MMKIAWFILPLVVAVLAASCQTVATAPGMSYEEARDVVLSMQSVPLEPPPRQMDDILAILDSRRDEDSASLDALTHRADMPVPDRQDPLDLYQFYRSRGDARYQLDRFKQSRSDIRKAIAYDEQADIGDGALYHRLAELEMFAGHYESALDLSKATIQVHRVSSWRRGPYFAFQSRVHQRMGNFFRANLAISNAKAAYRKVPAWARTSQAVYGGDMDMGTVNDILAAEAELLEARGEYTQAHEMRSRVLNYHYSKRRQKPQASVRARIDLSANLMYQNRLVMAEKQARMAVKAAVETSGRQSAVTADALQMLGRVMLAKGDVPNADTLSKAQIDILMRLGLSIDEDIMVRGRVFRAAVRFADDDFTAAMSNYELALKGMADNPYFYRRYAYRNSALIFCLIKTRRIPEARDLLRRTRSAVQVLGGPNAPAEAEIGALEAMILFAGHRTEAALDRFSAAVPVLVAITQDPGTLFPKRRLAEIFLETYIDMLLKHRNKNAGQTDASEKLFELFGVQTSRVNIALAESSARAASLVDPQLAELVRQEQDAGKKLKSLQAVFYNASAASGKDTLNPSLTALDRSIQSLTRAQAAIAKRIQEEFPRYANYIRPPPPVIGQVQSLLVPGEAFIAIWTLADATCVWAIPQKGAPAFAVTGLGKQAVRQMVARLRASLSPDARWLSEIPAFDTATAFELYDRILSPVEPAWRNATDLLVSIRGPLDQIPLAILPVEATHLRPGGLRFSEYRQVPWLIRKVSVTRLPSAAALVTLRTLPPGSPGRDAFAGFGDPVFTPKQTGAPAGFQASLEKPVIRGDNITIRGIRVSDLGRLDSGGIVSVGIEDLSPLPDTAEEINRIADTLGADPATDVFLGKAASESRVRAQDLSSKKVLAFATHALLPGDLDGLAQPALALSAPEVTQQDEDGLLTLGEILTLKLDADLVVLSACDTGAGDGRGSEAVSGLGRAFFYSGARALLVSMWPVETTSANKLTTGLFRYRENNPGVSWSRAQQKSIVEILDTVGMVDDTGTLVASYAHPLFWGPFVVIGDSGARQVPLKEK